MVDLTLPMYLPSSNMLSMKKLVSFFVISAVVKLVNRYLTTFTKISRSLKRPYPNYQMSSLCVFRAYTLTWLSFIQWHKKKAGNLA